MTYPSGPYGPARNAALPELARRPVPAWLAALWAGVWGLVRELWRWRTAGDAPTVVPPRGDVVLPDNLGVLRYRNIVEVDASWDAMLREGLVGFRVRRRAGRVAILRTVRAQARLLGWGAREAVVGLRVRCGCAHFASWCGCVGEAARVFRRRA